jgi:hypothetical protein
MGMNKGKISITFNCSTLILGMFSCHNLVLFQFCNKILLDYCLAHVVFLFLFFVFLVS